MKRRYIPYLMIWVILPSFLFVGCRPTATEEVHTLIQPMKTVKPIPTETPIPIPSETLEPTSIPLIDKDVDFEVRFTGDDCLASGPSQVTAGEYTFKFIQSNELMGELWLANLDEGKTIQDLRDGQSEPFEWYPKPTWAEYGTKISYEYETVNDIRVIISTWSLERIGEHIIYCHVRTPEKKLWFVAPIIVVAGNSE